MNIFKLIFKAFAVAICLFPTFSIVVGDNNNEKFDIKIVTGLPKKKSTYTHSSQPVTPTPSREPHVINPSTPSEFFGLDGKCFSENIGRYKYEICPFRNVTQLDKQTSWNPFYGILGLWGKWKEEGEGLSVDGANNLFNVQIYNDGTSCGNNINRKVQVNLICSEKYALSNVEEPHTCDYTMTFAMPECCNLNISSSAPSTIEASGSDVENHSEFIVTEEALVTGDNANNANNKIKEGNDDDSLEEITIETNGNIENVGDAITSSYISTVNMVSENNENKNSKNNICKLIPQPIINNVETPWSNFKEAELVKMDGDGDCGYSSVSYALRRLYGSRKDGIPNGSDLRKLVSLNPLKPPNLSKTSFVKAKKRSNNNEWAEDEELAILAYLYNTCIVVYQADATAFNRWSIIMPGINECPKDETIYLYYKIRTHFDVLVDLVEADRLK